MIFGHCQVGDHAHCKRTFLPYYFEGKRIVYREQALYCECKNRTCECYKQEKPVVKKRRRRKVENVELPDA